MVMAPSTCVPPVVQSGGEPPGPHTKNDTVPVTAPFGPLSVAVSVTDWPSVIVAALVCVVRVGMGKIDDALRERSWFPPLPSKSRKRM